MMKICGPKLSLCGLIISVWGIIQLVCMGFFYFFNCVALAEDLPLDLDKKIDNINQFYTDVEAAYKSNAFNCWIAACLYVFTMLISGHQFWMNSRSSL